MGRGASQEVNVVTSDLERCSKGNKQRPLTKERGRESALLKAVGEGAIGRGARTPDEQGQCLNDRNFFFLKKKKKESVTNDIKLTSSFWS